MSLYNVINRALIQSGQPEDVSQIVANLDAIATVLSQIDPVNLRGAPGLVAGEAPVWNGTNWDRSSVTRIEPTSLKPSAYGTSLPGSPYDGQEAILVDSTTAPTYQWRFRYNAGSSSNKWDFIGGASAHVRIDTSEATTSTAAVNLATVGPQFTLPRAGNYRVAFGAEVAGSGGGGGNAGIWVYNNASSTGVLVQSNVGAIASSIWAAVGEYQPFVFSAGDVVSLRFSISNGLSTSFSGRYMTITPVRVS